MSENDDTIVNLRNQGSGWPPSEEETIPDVPWTMFLDAPTNHWFLCMVYRYWRGQIAKYSIQIQALTNGEWPTVWRSDTSEDQIHRHQFDQDGSNKRLVRKSIECQNDVIEGSLEEYLYICDHWQDQKRRWERVQV